MYLASPTVRKQKSREFSGGPWLRLYTFTAEGPSSILVRELGSLQAAGCGPKKRKEIYMSNRKGLVQQMITPGNKGLLHLIEKESKYLHYIKWKKHISKQYKQCNLIFVQMHL